MIEGEERQARQMEEMYRLLLEHPLVQAVTGWDFSDGGWLGAPSGVIRKDNSAKPSWAMLQKLFHEEWHTAGEVRTDENGIAEVSGYKGSYSIAGDGFEGNFELHETSEEPVQLSLKSVSMPICSE